MTDSYDIYVVVHSATDELLDFDLIVEWGQKRYSLSRYEIAQFRGTPVRDIIQHLAAEWLEDAGEPAQNICLIFK
jgi:hypothetical protein